MRLGFGNPQDEPSKARSRSRTSPLGFSTSSPHRNRFSLSYTNKSNKAKNKLHTYWSLLSTEENKDEKKEKKEDESKEEKEVTEEEKEKEKDKVTDSRLNAGQQDC